MINLLLTPPFRFNVAPDALDHQGELAPVLAEYGVRLTRDPAEADLELVGKYQFLDQPVWRLPKDKVVVITPEPPQPDYLEATYLDSGFAAVLTPANYTAHAPDCLAYFSPPSLPRKRRIEKIDKIVLLATYRYSRGNDADGVRLAVPINGGEVYRHRTLAYNRSLTGLLVKRVMPEIIDLYGRYWPLGAEVLENSREDGDWHARKLELIGGYGFNLCWENSEIPGYVTEKIWDSLDAGVLPLYWGPPEFHDMLPPDSVLDCRQYMDGDDVNIEAMLGDVLSMSAAEYARRVETLYDWHRALDPEAKKKSALAAAHILGRELVRAHESRLARKAA
jgi:hypothetical protein